MREDIMEHMLQYRVRARRQVAVLTTLAVVSALLTVLLAFVLSSALPLAVFVAASIGVLLADAVEAWAVERKARRELERVQSDAVEESSHETAGV